MHRENVGITLGFTVLYLSVLVLIPIAVLSLKALSLSWSQLWDLATNARALAAYRIEPGRVLRGGFAQRRLWQSAGLGAGAIPVSRTAVAGRIGGRSLCPAHRGRRG